jgi:CHAD domain-containing protein
MVESMAKALPISDVAAETPFGAFAARVIEVRAGEVEALLAEPSVNGGAEHVHDRRVAIRRLRTAIEVFEPTLPKRARTVRRELKGVFSALGPRRDADVALEALRELEPELAAADLPGFRGLLAVFEAQGAAAAGALDTEAALKAGAAAGALATRALERGGPPAGKALGRLAARRLDDVRGRLVALDDPTDADALHGLRIAAKRLRYVLEAAAPALGAVAEDGARVARELQTVLGDVHDCDVLLPRLREHRRELRAADVAAVRSGRRPANAARYRGLQTVDTHLRARRDGLRAQAAAGRAASAAELDRVSAVLRDA